MTRDVEVFAGVEGVSTEEDAAAGEPGITEATLYTWRNVARRAGAVMPGGGQQKAEVMGFPGEVCGGVGDGQSE